MQRNRTGDQSEFEVAFPVGTHNQLLWFSVYAGDTVSKGSDALFDPRAGCEPLRSPRTLLLLLPGADVAVTRRQGEEPGATPGRAGDGAGDGGEARISRALPVESVRRDGDGVALALIIAKEHRAGFEPAPGRAAVTCQTVQERQAFPIEPAEGLLLQTASDHSPQHVLTQTRRRSSSEDDPPAPPKGIKRKQAQMSDLGLDRPVLLHGY